MGMPISKAGCGLFHLCTEWLKSGKMALPEKKEE
jgi:hypothetical protein